jgi:Tfp pilus assembly protein PilF
MLLGVHLITAGQTSSCECAAPPGGSVTCEKGQVPICIVKDGKVISICKSPPDSRKTVAQLNAWVLSSILGKEVTEEDLRLKPEYQGFLRQGRLKDGEASVVFQAFSPPSEFLQRRSFRSLSGTHVVGKYSRRHREPREEDRSALHYDRGKRLLSSGMFAEAEAEFRKALKITPYLAEAYLGIGFSLHSRGKLGEAEAAYRQGLRLEPTSADLNAAMGAIYYANDKFSQAETSLERAVSLEPSTADVYDALGTILYAQLKFADAEAAFRHGIRLKPDDAVLYTKLGDALYAQQKFAEAESAFTIAISLKPESADLYTKLGDALTAQQKGAEAKAFYIQAEKLKNNHP